MFWLTPRDFMRKTCKRACVRVRCCFIDESRFKERGLSEWIIKVIAFFFNMFNFLRGFLKGSQWNYHVLGNLLIDVDGFCGLLWNALDWIGPLCGAWKYWRDMCSFRELNEFSGGRRAIARHIIKCNSRPANYSTFH